MGKKKAASAKADEVSSTPRSGPVSRSTSGSSNSSSRHVTSKWLRDLSRANLAALLLVYILFIHLTGLFTFMRGFLLSRLSVPMTSDPYTAAHPAPIPPTHSKAVILIIDALRTDFISPHHPFPTSPNHHGVLTLPAELAAADSHRSLIFNGVSDPPTTTMQRIKGITTGSLPTFIDIGANFASTAIEEDTFISQLVASDRKIAFMGDDTWVNLFPNSFTHTHPYDSFNVEDLHSVDNGVIEHLFPYLDSANSSKWDVLIGHFLGVDHVGHRVGPERDTMKFKLEQMDQVLRNVVEKLDSDTLLIVMGDHGMDQNGNHGGDSEMETAAALWLYSKGPELTGGVEFDRKLSESWPTYTFPGSTAPIRHVNQIDLVPTLSLLLGIPIPFNNLGIIIPECFASDMARLEIATRVNTEQIMRYIAQYGDSDVASTLALLWDEAQVAVALLNQAGESDPKLASASTATLSKWLRTGTDEGEPDYTKLLQAQHRSINVHRRVALLALEQLRALWAQFSVPMIVVGLSVLGLSIPALFAIYIAVRNNGANWDIYVRIALDTVLLPSTVASSLTGAVTAIYTKDIIVAIKSAIVIFALVSETLLSLPILVQLGRPNVESWSLTRAIGPLIMVLHAVSFASNSFIMWEDRMVVFLLNTIPVIYCIKSFLAPTSTMRYRILGGSLVSMALTRLAGAVTVCREEQQPYCQVSFYSGSTPAASPYALGGILFLALHLPRAIGMTLDLSKSLAGPAPMFLGKAWRVTLVANAVYWLLEWVESWDGLQPARIPLVRVIRLWLGRSSFVSILLILPYLWTFTPLCIQVKRDPDQTGDSKAVTVLGFANAYGSTYLLFLLIPFTAVHLVSQPMAQLTLSALLIAILAHLEVVDTQHDAVILSRSFASSSTPGAFEPSASSTTLVRPSFTDSVPIILMGFLGFFATGHQAVLTSIQWKAAFVGFNAVTYPFSPILVIINTWGPFVISILAIPLLAIWNVSPRPQSSIPILTHALQLCLCGIIYHTTVTFASAVCAAWLRRHLMVWKVFAPRFMLAGCTLVIVDLTVLAAVVIGLRLTSWKVWKTFKCVSV